MIELRWVWRDEPAPELGPDIARRVKVLQYRYQGDWYEFGTGKRRDWSEWQDVPTASEGRG